MLEKIKGWSFGKKIYTTLWGAWAILLATLIGLFVGLKGDMAQKTDPKTGWTLSRSANADKLITSATSDTGVAGQILFDATANKYANFFVKDLAGTTTASPAIIAAIKAAITPAKFTKAGIVPNKDDLKIVIRKVNALTIPVAVPNGKTGTATKEADHATINLMNEAINKNTVWKSLADAKLAHDVKNLYDLGITYAKPTGGTPVYLNTPTWKVGKWTYPDTTKPNAGVYTPGSYTKHNVGIFGVDKWDSKLTDHAKMSVNITASFGLLALVAMIGAIGTTVHVSIKAKKGGKK